MLLHFWELWIFDRLGWWEIVFTLLWADPTLQLVICHPLSVQLAKCLSVESQLISTLSDGGAGFHFHPGRSERFTNLWDVWIYYLSVIWKWLARLLNCEGLSNLSFAQTDCTKLIFTNLHKFSVCKLFWYMHFLCFLPLKVSSFLF